MSEEKKSREELELALHNAEFKFEIYQTLREKKIASDRERIKGLEEEVRMLLAYLAYLIDMRIDDQGPMLRIPKEELRARSEEHRYLISSDQHAYYIRRVL